MSTYTVRKGDTLSAIAQSQLGSASRWPEIARLNSLDDPDLIYPGQQLAMPAGGGKGLVASVLDWLRK